MLLLRPVASYMRVVGVLDGLYRVDLEPGGFQNLVSVYVADGGRSLAVFEGGPAVSGSDLASALRSLGKPVEAVFLTHVHIDHYGGAGAVLGLGGGVRFYVHPRGARVLPNPDVIWVPARAAMGWLGELYGRPLEIPADRSVETRDGDRIAVGDISVEVIHTPGHASHHQSFLLEPWGVLFVGDAAGIYLRDLDYVIPTTMEPLRLDLYIESVKKLMRRGPRYIAYTHYDLLPDAVSMLERHLAQLEVWRRSAEEAAREGLDAKDLEEVLVERDQGLRRAYEGLRGRRAHYHLFQMAVEGILNYFKKG
jgi:glyoxylase-like metal-dependent hydrolase (beta-lactamase superfamily II)